ncbi:MAG: efflux RND transporter periplasmic adaptor subunit [Proteobacteria bacterium]|nr:efflux RND transporter periplasmic adaptor subunit [Pseudomonadota bacterium]
MKRSYLLAAGLALGATLWVASGIVDLDALFGRSPAPAARPVPPPEPGPVRVRVIDSLAESRIETARVMGRTGASRSVTLRAETEGRIAALGAEKGARLEAGAAIAQIALEDREARLAEAKALIAQRQLEFEATRTLAERNYRSETSLAEARARLESANAARARIEVDIRNTTLRAPFAGVVESRGVELGDFVKVGDPVATLLDLDPILVVASLPEGRILHLRLGALASARLSTGEMVEGVVSYVAPSSEPTTRTYRVEIEAPNPGGRVPTGLTASLAIPLEPARVHRIPPSALSLGESGEVGVKVVDAGDRVRFLPVRVVANERDGVWLAGLPQRIRLLTVGHEYVAAGQKVEPVPEEMHPALSAAGDGR